MSSFTSVIIISSLLFSGVAAPKLAATVGAKAAESDKAITLAEAHRLALERSPRLAGACMAVKAADARRIQAGLRPNPELGFVFREFGGDGSRGGFDSALSILQVGQVFELGGKRRARSELAAADGALAGWDLRSLQLDVLAGTSVAFAKVLSLQERFRLDQEKVVLARRVVEAVRQRVEAGKVSPLDSTRAGIELSTALIHLENTRRELESARKQLAAQWGDNTPSFQSVAGDLYAVAPLTEEKELRGGLSRNPDLARWDQEIERQQLAARLAKSAAWPDLTLSGGILRFNRDDETSFIVGFSIPIKLFDRNQGGILAAAAGTRRAEVMRLAAELDISARLAELYGTLASAHSAISVLRTELIPAAEKAFEAIEEGYRLGKFGLLEVLDAQKTLFEAREQQIEMLAVYHIANARVERLTGAHLAKAEAALPETN